MSTDHEHPHDWTRREVLGMGALAALGAVIGTPGAAVADAPRPTFAGLTPHVAGMHVHATYSEGPGSWDQQYFAAKNAGSDVL